MEELIKNKNTKTIYAHVWKSLTLEKILHQTTLGVDYLHGLSYIHRNIHARNVLVAQVGSGINVKYVVKLSDFRLGKPVEKNPDHSLEGTPSNWIAPEMEEGKKMPVGSFTDVFILGCFFHYVFSGGEHPFGPGTQRVGNIVNTSYNPILERETILSAFRGDERKANRLIALIEEMITRETEQRPDLNRILNYFQTKDYFPIYETLIKNRIALKPGLCVIFNQQIFDDVSTNLLV